MTARSRSLIGAYVIASTLSVPARSQLLEGRVLDKATRAPLGRVDVRLAHDTGTGAAVMARTTTDSSGFFYLDVPAPGEYNLVMATTTGAFFVSPVRFESKDDEVQREYLLEVPAKAYFEFQVEKQVEPVPGNPAPHYPELMRQQKIEGEVLAQFVVDTLGRAEMATFRILKSTDPEFTVAVRLVIPQSRFYPARLAGHPVRQLVQMPFIFSLNR